MDYESMTTPQLQAECRRRGLPTSRTKDVLVQRLRESDGTQDRPTGEGVEPAAELELSVEPEPERVVTEKVPREAPVAPAPEPRATGRRGWQPAPPSVFRKAYPVCPGGPDEQQHATYREATLRAAVEAGHEPRGGAYRIGTTPDGEVYEINIRWRR